MLAFLFVAIAIAVRFLPHTFHFTPVGASLLFFGAKQPRKWMWLPVVAMAASDVALNTWVYHYPVSIETFVSTAWYALALFIGGFLKKNSDKFQLGYIAGASLAGSVSFYIISNFGVWAYYNMYPHTLSGLFTCYLAAIPFFTPTLASDMLYTLGFFATPFVVDAIKKQMSGEHAIDDDIAAA